MKSSILKQCSISRGSGGKRTPAPGYHSALIIINGIKFESEKPINDAHAELINETLNIIKANEN